MRQRMYKKGFGIVEILIIAAAVVLIAGLGWLFVSVYFAPNNETTADDKATSKQDTLAPRDVTATIKAHLEKEYTLLDIEGNNQPKKGELSIREDAFAPPYLADGFNYYTTHKNGSSLFIVTPQAGDTELPSAVDKQIRQDAAAIFHLLGLTSIETREDTAGASTTNVYAGKGLVCTIDTPDAAVGASEASCGVIASYADTADALQPIVSTLEYTDGTTVFSGEEKQSETDGYSMAEISVGNIRGGGGAVALLWKKDDGDWQLFKYVQQLLSCEEYNTDDLRAAFSGHDCYDTSSEKTVTVTAAEEE